MSEVDQLWIDGCRLQVDRVGGGKGAGTAGVRAASRRPQALEGEEGL